MRSIGIMMLVAIGLMAQNATPPPTPPKTVPIPKTFITESQALSTEFGQLAQQQEILRLKKENLELRIRMEVGLTDGQVDWQSGTVREAPKPQAAAPTPPADPKKK